MSTPSTDTALWCTLGGSSGTAHLVRGAWTLCGRAAAPAGSSPVPVDARVLTDACRLCSSIGAHRYTIGELSGLGLTVRQIHHWCERGWIRFTWAGPRRVFDPLEYRVARRAVALIKVGYRTEVALERARATVDDPSDVQTPQV